MWRERRDLAHRALNSGRASWWPCWRSRRSRGAAVRAQRWFSADPRQRPYGQRSLVLTGGEHGPASSHSIPSLAEGSALCRGPGQVTLDGALQLRHSRRGRSAPASLLGLANAPAPRWSRRRTRRSRSLRMIAGRQRDLPAIVDRSPGATGVPCLGVIRRCVPQTARSASESSVCGRETQSRSKMS